MKKKKSIVHIGAGKLGLGFIGDIFNDLGFSLNLLNRRSDKRRHTLLRQNNVYYIRFIDNNKSKVTPISRFEFLPENDYAVHPSIELLADSNVNMWTVSIGRVNDHHTLIPTMYEALQKRCVKGTSDPLFILSCENEADNIKVLREELHKQIFKTGSQELKNYLLHQIEFVSTVADRACPQIQCYSSNVEVCAERHQNWVLNVSLMKKDNFGLLQELLKENKYIYFVDTLSKFEMYEKRKFWLINGIHLAVATYAYHNRIKLLSDAIWNVEVRWKIKNLQTEFSYALHDLAVYKNVNKDFSVPEIDKFNEAFLTRIAVNREDEVNRIFHDLVGVSKIDKILTEIKDKKAEKILSVNYLLQKLEVIVELLSIDNFTRKAKARLIDPVYEIARRKKQCVSSAELVAALFEVLHRFFENYSLTIKKFLPLADY